MIKRNNNNETTKLIDQSVNAIINELEQVGMLPKDEFQFIIEASISIIKFEPNVLKIESPLVIVGDIHGQFYDLVAIFRRHGLPPQTKYLFLGDYVDRGDFSIEVITLLFFMKIKYPKSITLLRGNHECRMLTNTHNFKNECKNNQENLGKNKYSLKVYELTIILFETLPLCAIVDSKYFCVHAGISPNLYQVDHIQKISRFCEIPEKGVMCDMLWSDPTDEDKKEWTFNSNRSCSYFYTRTHLQTFLTKNKLSMVIRGHEVHLEGYRYQNNEHRNHQTVLTIFSAPNYCDRYNNLGAVAIINKNKIELDTFKHVEHPYVLPNNVNIFEWSINLISTEVIKIFIEIMKTNLIKKEKIILEPIEKIKEKIELFEQIETFNKLIKEKENQPKLYSNQNNNIEFENDSLIPNSIKFSTIKINDQKEEAMPNNISIKNQEKEEENFYENNNDEIEYNDDDTKDKSIIKKMKKMNHFNQLKKFPSNDENITIDENSNEKDDSLNTKSISKENIQIIGPKIIQFEKINVKRKNK